MKSKNLNEMKLVVKGLVTFVTYCVPLLVFALPIFITMVSGQLWWLWLLPVTAVLGVLVNNATIIIFKN